MFRAIVHALWSSVILVGLAGKQFADNSPGLSTELELASSVKTSVHNSISIVMITMHNMANPGYYSLAILVITLGFPHTSGKIAPKYISAALNSTLDMQDVSLRTWYQEYSSL